MINYWVRTLEEKLINVSNMVSIERIDIKNLDYIYPIGRHLRAKMIDGSAHLIKTLGVEETWEDAEKDFFESLK